MSVIFAKRLRKLRKSEGLTQRELAEAIGVSRIAVVEWEKGSRTPSLEALVRIADFFDVSVDYLLGRVE